MARRSSQRVRGETRARAAACALVIALSVVLGACQGEEPRPVTVALVDTGVATTLDQFAGYAIQQAAEAPSADHGTMMLSVLLGVSSTESDALPADRVSVLSYDVGATPTAESLAAAIDTATESGADLISISMGVRRDNPMLRSAVERASEQGVIIVAAAGNVRFLASDYPARYDEVIAVAALQADGSYWSGSATKDVDTAALGVNVPVLDSLGSTRIETGTSIAAATVASRVVASVIAGDIDGPADFTAPPPP